MTKQEEIREGIEKLRREAFGDDGSGYFTDTLLVYLRDNDVVIKVEEILIDGDTEYVYAVESLIEEKQ